MLYTALYEAQYVQDHIDSPRSLSDRATDIMWEYEYNTAVINAEYVFGRYSRLRSFYEDGDSEGDKKEEEKKDDSKSSSSKDGLITRIIAKIKKFFEGIINWFKNLFSKASKQAEKVTNKLIEKCKPKMQEGYDKRKNDEISAFNMDIKDDNVKKCIDNYKALCDYVTETIKKIKAYYINGQGDIPSTDQIPNEMYKKLTGDSNPSNDNDFIQSVKTFCGIVDNGKGGQKIKISTYSFDDIIKYATESPVNKDSLTKISNGMNDTYATSNREFFAKGFDDDDDDKYANAFALINTIDTYAWKIGVEICKAVNNRKTYFIKLASSLLIGDENKDLKKQWDEANTEKSEEKKESGEGTSSSEGSGAATK